MNDLKTNENKFYGIYKYISIDKILFGVFYSILLDSSLPSMSSNLNRYIYILSLSHLVLEMHHAKENLKEYWRIFTHYGRLEDLSVSASTPSKEEENIARSKSQPGGRKECRYLFSQNQADVSKSKSH